MPFRHWFEHRKRQERDARDKRGVPDGIWSKCANCGDSVWQKDILSNYQVCPECGFHFHLSPYERVSLLLDDGTFVADDDDILPKDPLVFSGPKPYRQSLNNAIEVTGHGEAVLTGHGMVDDQKVGFGAMDFRFIGGSMGSVVGEKITRLFERATEERIPVITVTNSGGARMQEGVLSLMQMAKTAAAVERHNQAGLPYISILANPTTGGVLASFASLGDVIIAEPQALIGFAGPRVIEQALNEKPPKGFQGAELVLQNGMIDMIASRAEMRVTITQLINYLASEEFVGAAEK